MRVIIDDDGTETIETGERCLDGDSIEVTNANGFGSCNVQVCGALMTWRQFDELANAMKEAERRWRK